MAQISIKVSLSNAIRAGELRHGVQTLTVDSWDGWTADELATLADLTCSNSEHNPLELTAATTNALLTAARTELQRQKHKIAQEKEKSKERIEKEKQLKKLEKTLLVRIKEDGIDSLLESSNLYREKYCPHCGYEHNVPYKQWSTKSYTKKEWGEIYWHNLPQSIQLIAEKEASNRQGKSRKEFHENFEKHIVECKEKERKKEENKKERKAEWADLVELALSDEQKERKKADFLSGKEQNNTVRNHIFSAIDAKYNRYDKITSEEIEHNDECYCEENNYNYWIEDTETLTATQFAALKTLEKDCENLINTEGITDKSIEPITHYGECKNCELVTTRIGLRVTLTFKKGNEVTREYELGDAQ